MRILYVIAGMDPAYGGPSKSTLDAAVALVRSGHHAAIYTTNRAVEGYLDVPLDRPVLVRGVPIHYFPIRMRRRWDFSRRPRGDAFEGRRWGYSQPMGDAIRNTVAQFDLVHIHGLYEYPILVAATESHRKGVPYVISPHGALDPFLRRRRRIRKAVYMTLFEKRNLDNAAAIFYTTQDEMELVHSSLKLRSPGIVVPLTVDLEEYSHLPPRGAFRSRHPEMEGRFIILFLGRVNFKKGLDLLSQAFSEVASRRPEVHLVIAGPDSEGYGHQVREWLREKNVLDRVTFTGMVTGEEKLSVYRDADVFVLPSYSENYGIVVTEAMACGLPVITTNRVNIYRQILEHNAGLVIDCEARQLTRAILRLMDDRELRETFRKNGERLVKGEFGIETTAPELVSAYRAIIDQRLPRH
jgi:glycosyltransferase involved in cell wall biosynthesis